MIVYDQKYTLFPKFIGSFSPSGLQGIDPDNHLLPELENIMKCENQFFSLADLIQVKILFTSKRSVEMIGVIPEDVTPFHFIESMHTDDI